MGTTGGMNLAWTSDRIGPICRDAEDAAIVFATIHGSDAYDRASRTMPFNYTGAVDLKNVKVAYQRTTSTLFRKTVRKERSSKP